MSELAGQRIRLEVRDTSTGEVDLHCAGWSAFCLERLRPALRCDDTELCPTACSLHQSSPTSPLSVQYAFGDLARLTLEFTLGSDSEAPRGPAAAGRGIFAKPSDSSPVDPGAKGEATDAIFTLRSQSEAKDGPPCGNPPLADHGGQEPQGFLAKEGEIRVRSLLCNTSHKDIVLQDVALLGARSEAGGICFGAAADEADGMSPVRAEVDGRPRPTRPGACGSIILPLTLTQSSVSWSLRFECAKGNRLFDARHA